jgi:hypothetical protein
VPAPVFSGFVERLYGRLPDHYRESDEELAAGAAGYPLKRFLALLGDQAGAVEALMDRIDFRPLDEGGIAGDTSELVDFELADVAWLDWLAQLVGVALEPKLTEPERRDAIEFAPGGWRAATKSAMAAAARTELTGTEYASIHDHSDASVGGVGTKTQWDVLVVTRPSETPGPAQVLAAIIAKGAKPAGVVLYWRAYEASWDTLEAAYPTWNAWDATGSWDVIQETGL